MKDRAERKRRAEERAAQFKAEAATLAVDQCVRMWHQAVEFEGSFTLQRVCRRAVRMALLSRRVRDLWVQSVRVVRDQGLLEPAAAHGIIHAIVLAHMNNEEVPYEPETRRALEQEQGEFLRKHGGAAFRTEGELYEEWMEMMNEWDSFDGEKLAAALLEVGEAEMSVMVVDDEDRYMELVEEAEFLLKETEKEARTSWREERRSGESGPGEDG